MFSDVTEMNQALAEMDQYPLICKDESGPGGFTSVARYIIQVHRADVSPNLLDCYYPIFLFVWSIHRMNLVDFILLCFILEICYRRRYRKLYKLWKSNSEIVLTFELDYQPLYLHELLSLVLKVVSEGAVFIS